MRQAVLSFLLVLALSPGGSALAQTEVGEVSFANSGAPAAQEPFLRGLALLHNFEYPDAAAQFRKAREIDPDFAMACWGEAMTFNHPVWMQQDLAAARAALGRLGATPEARLAKARTERERDYLRAVEILYGEGTKEERDFRYSDAMAALHQRYPDDVDATAFYALSLLGTAHHGRDFADLHAVRGAAGGGLPHPSAPSRRAALPDPFLRRSHPRPARHAGGAALRRRGAERGARAPHDLSHFRGARPVGRGDRRQRARHARGRSAPR